MLLAGIYLFLPALAQEENTSDDSLSYSFSLDY
jgi:hypothetical protein